MSSRMKAPCRMKAPSGRSRPEKPDGSASAGQVEGRFGHDGGGARTGALEQARWSGRVSMACCTRRYRTATRQTMRAPGSGSRSPARPRRGALTWKRAKRMCAGAPQAFNAWPQGREFPARDDVQRGDGQAGRSRTRRSCWSSAMIRSTASRRVVGECPTWPHPGIPCPLPWCAARR